jgi:RNA polymerase sigma-70 factor (ECF subfamily)
MAVDRRELARMIPSLRRYARGLAGDRATADDLVQDCLVRALDRERQFDGTNLSGWVFTILTNITRSHFRALGRRPQTDQVDDVAGSGDADPATRVAITAALAGLSDDLKQPLLLTSVEGFTYRETADMLGIPIGTVMSRIARARTALAERLEGAPVVPLRRIR